jgi:hypothetical protein
MVFILFKLSNKSQEKPFYLKVFISISQNINFFTNINLMFYEKLKETEILYSYFFRIDFSDEEISKILFLFSILL